MMYSDLDGDDLRYLQSDDFSPGPRGPWIRSENLFEQRLAKNLRAGRRLFLDLDTLARVVATAALLRHRSEILVFDLELQQAERCAITVVTFYAGLPSICADVSGSLLPALRWYCARAESIRLAVAASGFFWFPLPGGTHESS